jgi:RNA polymerase sigma-70 factor, ECF subfamily
MKVSSFSTISDLELMARFVAGERGALGALAERYERPLLGLAKGLLGGDASAACDAVQSMWVRVIRYAKGFLGKSEVKTWLYRILINECRDMKRAREFPGTTTQLRLARDGRAHSPVMSDGGDELQTALAKLVDERREVLLICYHAGMTHEVAAEVLEIPLGTLKSRLHAGLNELRLALGDTAEGEVVA